MTCTEGPSNLAPMCLLGTDGKEPSHRPARGHLQLKPEANIRQPVMEGSEQVDGWGALGGLSREEVAGRSPETPRR